jgi:LacI family transcriptional regulator
MIVGIAIPFSDAGETMRQNPYYSELLAHVSMAAANEGWAILLVPPKFAQLSDSEQKGFLNRLDGVLVIDPISADRNVEIALRNGKRIVTIGRSLTHENLPFVDNSFSLGMEQILEHALEQGYKFPTLILSAEKDSYQIELRKAFTDGAKRRSLRAKILHLPSMEEVVAYQNALRILSSKHRPDLIVAYTDWAAVAVLRAARNLGIRVPESLGVVGAGDTVLATTSNPTLTTITPFPQLLAAAAVRLFIEGLSDQAAPAEVILSCELIVRASTNRPPRSELGSLPPEKAPRPAVAPTPRRSRRRHGSRNGGSDPS